MIQKNNLNQNAFMITLNNQIKDKTIKTLDKLYEEASLRPTEQNLNKVFKEFNELNHYETDFNLLMENNILYYTYDIYDTDYEPTKHIKTYELQKELEPA